MNECLVPDVDPSYIKWGHHDDLVKIITSGMFFPIFITGESGNGKSLMVIQAAAEAKREIIKVSITCETDEDDLLGGLRLKNGATYFQHGPVVDAMRRGAILLLDEIDLATPKIMCLQPILEGNSVYLKKNNELIEPKPGFNVIATANTKGKGSQDGKYIGTNILNEAFLDRFSITLEQPYAPLNTELNILQTFCEANNIRQTKLLLDLIKWADQIRLAYKEGSINESISTRRLLNIVKINSIYECSLKSIKQCISRFDDETKAAFLEFFSKVSIDGTSEKDLTPKMMQEFLSELTAVKPSYTPPDYPDKDPYVPF